MENPSQCCDVCGGEELNDGDDGFYYCGHCGSLSQNLIQTDHADEDVYGEGALYSRLHHRAPSHHQAPPPKPPTSDHVARILANLAGGSKKEEEEAERPYGFEDEVSVPQDFGSGPRPDVETLANGVRLRYLQGMQVMVQLQCEALVERFGVRPLICGIVPTIWLRYVAASRVFDEEWVRKAIAIAESAAAQSGDGQQEEKKLYRRANSKYKLEPCNLYGKKAENIFLRALRRTIPVNYSLAICFLVCHVVREAILPTDIFEWALEGKLPYLSAFVDIDKCLGNPSNACPLSSRTLFRPVRVIGAWQLEATAGSIAQLIGLRLPSVNFYVIACRYLKDLFLPAEKILPHACRLYEWSIPTDLWLSSNVYRLPTRVCVMSILIVTIRILYNIHGQGMWEKSSYGLSNSSSHNQLFHLNSGPLSLRSVFNFEKRAGDAKENDSLRATNSSNLQTAGFNTEELLCSLEAAYDKISITHDFSKDLPSYLKYCEEVVFPGIKTSYEEETLMKRLWDIYIKQEDVNPPEEGKTGSINLKGKRSGDGVTISTSSDAKKPKEEKLDNLSDKGRPVDECVATSLNKLTNKDCFADNSESLSGERPTSDYPSTVLEYKAVEEMKLNMEENGFQYLSPRVKQKSDDYLHYMRKKEDGRLIYVAHADYYILLRACAKLAQVDVRIMHLAVLKLEKRLAWTEERIDSSMSSLPEISRQLNYENNIMRS